MKRQHTLASVLGNPKVIFPHVRRLFPQVNWRRSTLDTPEVRSSAEHALARIENDKNLLAFPIFKTLSLPTLVNDGFDSFCLQEASWTGGNLTDYERAVGFTVVFLHELVLTSQIMVVQLAVYQAIDQALVIVADEYPSVTHLGIVFDDIHIYDKTAEPITQVVAEPERNKRQVLRFIPRNSSGEDIN